MRLTAKASHRRYANVKDYEAFRDGKRCGCFQTNAKTQEAEAEQIREICEISRCDKLFLIWSARTGRCWEEVII